MRQEVVVFDPRGEIPEGRVFRENDARIVEAKRRGAVALKVDGRPQTALGPWAKAAFGDGLAIAESVPAYVGSVALHVLRGKAGVSWGALVSVPRNDAAGTLRIVGDPRQVPIHTAPTNSVGSIEAVLSSSLPQRGNVALIDARLPNFHPERALLSVWGYAPCQVMQDAVVALCLHGWARHGLLHWLAVAQTE